jgi:hypothetical protein
MVMSVRMFQLENRWTDFESFWYERYANLTAICEPIV